MPSIGRVKSTALTGGSAPVFEGVAKETQALTKVSKQTGQEVQELRNEINELKQLIRSSFAAKEPVPEDTVPEPEPTPQEKAAKTRAENKAKAEAEAAKD